MAVTRPDVSDDPVLGPRIETQHREIVVMSAERVADADAEPLA